MSKGCTWKGESLPLYSLGEKKQAAWEAKALTVLIYFMVCSFCAVKVSLHWFALTGKAVGWKSKFRQQNNRWPPHQTKDGLNALCPPPLFPPRAKVSPVILQQKQSSRTSSLLSSPDIFQCFPFLLMLSLYLYDRVYTWAMSSVWARNALFIAPFTTSTCLEFHNKCSEK